MTSVTFPLTLGGDGSTITDDSNPLTGLGNGGHRYRFVTSLVQMVAMAQTAVTAANTAVTSPASLSATSTTSLTISTGSKSLTLAQTGKSFNVNSYVTVASTANPANFMFGQITAFTPATGAMTVNVLSVGGSGTLALWSINASQPNFSLYNPSNGSLSFYFDGSNIALGGTSYPWMAGIKAIDFGNYGIIANWTNGDFWFGRNTYFNGTSWIAKGTGNAALYGESGGTHYWYAAASVSAGAAQTFAETMRLDQNGNLSALLTVGAPTIIATGANATITFQDRTTTTNYWSWYSTGNTLRLWSGIAGFTGDKLTLDASGNLTISGTLSGASLSNGTVTTAKLATGAVTSNELASGACTPAKLSTGGPSWDASSNLTVSGNLSMNSGYGSAAVAYGCRAWVNFNGTGSTGANQTIRGSGNVSSVFKNGTGDYTVNFTTAMPDANYGAVMTHGGSTGIGTVRISTTVAPTTSALRINGLSDSGQNSADAAIVNVAIFR